MGTSSEISKETVAVYYIDRVDEGEGVAPDTANKELTVICHWFDEHKEHFPHLQDEHPVKNKTVDDLKKRAKLWYQSAPVQKTGLEVSSLKRLFGDGEISGNWCRDHSLLCVGTMFFFLARSVAAAHLVWGGMHQGPIANNYSSVGWFHDKHGNEYTRIDVGRDKTLRFKVKCNRFLPKDNGSGIDFGKFIRDYIRHYKLPSGCYLLAARNAKGVFNKTKFSNWSRVVNFVCDTLSLEREDYGTQSFRRGCAEWLSANGADFEQIGLLGFWLSSAVRIYTGTQAEPRLQVWRTTGQAST